MSSFSVFASRQSCGVISLGLATVTPYRGRSEPCPTLKEEIKRLQGYQCVVCGASGCELTIDHIKRRASGGTAGQENLRGACSLCHRLITDIENRRDFSVLARLNIILLVIGGPESHRIHWMIAAIFRLFLRSRIDTTRWELLPQSRSALYARPARRMS